jgi:hypothetical protein
MKCTYRSHFRHPASDAQSVLCRQHQVLPVNALVVYPEVAGLVVLR